MTDSGWPRRILVVRRDNIGDLVCTTPALLALRARFPAAQIDVLANAYNAPVLAGHPAFNRLLCYTKRKHLAGTYGGRRAAINAAIDTVRERLRLVRDIRSQHYDVVVVAPPGARTDKALRWAFGKAQILTTPPTGSAAGQHHVEEVFALLAPLGIVGEPPALMIAQPALDASTRGPRLAIHISARKPSQRWPVHHHIDLIKQLANATDWHFDLFWSPGASDDPQHPGDDALASAIIAGLGDLEHRLTPMPTPSLAALIAGLARADWVFCSDGGAMHIAAALGKPIVCLFGQSSVTRWRPWRVPHQVLQCASQDVRDIPVATVIANLHALTARDHDGT
jgi:heptosyltransferase III